MKSVVYSITNDENYLEVLTCQIVRLIKNNQLIKMSKREGNFITLREVYNSVGKDALRYYMISTKNETSIDFDMDRVVEKNKDLRDKLLNVKKYKTYMTTPTGYNCYESIIEDCFFPGEEFSIKYEVKIVSANRTPDR